MNVLIVTGSRDWPNEQQLIDILTPYLQTHKLFVGDCRTGADMMAAGLFPNRQVFVAQWKTYGKAAGIKRNHEMVDAALEHVSGDTSKVLCIGFRKDKSRGTTDTLEYSLSKKIPTFVIDI